MSTMLIEVEISRIGEMRNYPIVIDHEKGTEYGVEIPDLPGCFFAGETLDEAITNAREAVEFH